MKKTILNILFLAILVLPAGAANPKALLIKGNKPHGELLSNVRSIKFSTGNLMLKTVTAETSFAINGIARINFGELPVCEIGTATYSTLEAALIAVKDGETIKLLADILFDAAAYDQGLGIGNNITFDLNGKTLDVVSDFEAAVWVTGSNASLNLLDPANGAFNAIGIGGGIATFLGAKATVTNAVATETDAAAYAGAGSQTTVTANVTSADCGVYADKGTVVVGGNVLITGAGGCGVFATGGGKATIDGTITVPAGATYIKVGATVKTPTDNTVPTTKAGYLTYTDGTSTVWVKGTNTAIKTVELPNLEIYPNPVKYELRITKQCPTSVNYEGRINRVDIYDLTGKTVLSQKMNGQSINVANLPQGIYFVKIETDRGVVTRKFIKE